MPPRTVAIIGSFRQHYEGVLRVHTLFRSAGLHINSPKGDPIVKPGIPFVRFTSDPADAHDPMVQTIALHRILAADFVYVSAPEGYVGKTTCYEIGRVIQAGRPIFFSEQPRDLPIRVPVSNIKTAEELVTQIQIGLNLTRMYEAQGDEYGVAEEDLVRGKYRNA